MLNLKHASHTYLDDSEVKRLIALSQSGDMAPRNTCQLQYPFGLVRGSAVL